MYITHPGRYTRVYITHPGKYTRVYTGLYTPRDVYQVYTGLYTPREVYQERDTHLQTGRRRGIPEKEKPLRKEAPWLPEERENLCAKRPPWLPEERERNLCAERSPFSLFLIKSVKRRLRALRRASSSSTIIPVSLLVVVEPCFL